ncbi:serine O-acetyltransferase [Bacillus anthracis]|uniref:serine O-acetyltransferase n=1 Tax=Bacillus wiedmannii TaxID=1890302 RepID=UPI000BF9CB43|nr:serine O-acetyltransferase [Bacillus wiedmannii]PEP13958.1 serine O-acetyltransferase [Bacillus wiedmannii]PFJ23876.1 serine O-acetyltransferase [Bacillus anthracis]
MFKKINEDIMCVLNSDPAVKNKIEVILCYSGVHAIWLYRISHFFWMKNFLLTARIISQLSKFLTGIEIHPGAKIGRRLFIDHGVGVVVGETCEIGNDVTLFQGVTLGGTGKESGKRHPNIGDNCIISSGAKVLGAINIGEYSKVGAGAVVLKDVPSNSTVVGVPGQIVIHNGKRTNNLQPQKLLEEILDSNKSLKMEIEDLKKEMQILKREKTEILVTSNKS